MANTRVKIEYCFRVVGWEDGWAGREHGEPLQEHPGLLRDTQGHLSGELYVIFVFGESVLYNVHYLLIFFFFFFF